MARNNAPHNPDGTFAADPTLYDPSRPAPELDGTLETNLKFVAWVVAEKAAGRMSDRTADSLIGGAKAEQTGIGKKHSQTELDQLRALVETMKSAVDSLSQRERQDRYTASGSPAPTATVTLGRVRATPDGEPH